MALSSRRTASPRKSLRAPKADAPADTDDSSVNQRVYLELKQQILRSRLRPGQRLGHLELATMLNVSRTPVREALERLNQEGYVTRLPRRGFSVGEINTEQARNLYQTREALELFALDMAMDAGVSEADIKKLERLHQRYENHGGSGGMLERQEIDRDMHMHLAALSGNDYLVRLLGEIFERLMLKRRTDGYFSTERHPTSSAEHKLLMQALREGDKREAQRVLRKHLRGAWAAFEQHLDNLKR